MAPFHLTTHAIVLKRDERMIHLPGRPEVAGRGNRGWLAQEPIEIQRAVIGILTILKSIAKRSD